MTLLLTVLALRNTRIHVGTSHHCNDTSYIETSVNNFLCIVTILGIPYVNPDNSYVQFKGDLDNAWFWCKNDIIKDMIVLENVFNIFRRDTSVGFVNKVWDAHNFKIGLWLRKLGKRNTIIVYSKGTLDIFFNLLEIRIHSYIVCRYDDVFVCTNKISANVGFDAFEILVNINNMWRWILNKSFTKVATHGNNNLFMRRTLGDHVESQFSFVIRAIDDFLNGVNLFVRKIGKCFLDLQSVHYYVGGLVARIRLRSWGLCIWFLCCVFFDFLKEFGDFLNFFGWFGWNKR